VNHGNVISAPLYCAKPPRTYGQMELMHNELVALTSLRYICRNQTH